MKYTINTLLSLYLMMLWIAGFVLAKGFWSTFFCIFPFYAWYLVIEKIFIIYKII